MTIRPHLSKLITIIALVLGAGPILGTSAAPEISAEVSEKARPYQRMIQLDRQICATTDADKRARLLQRAPQLMKEIVTKTFTVVGDQDGEHQIFRTYHDCRNIAHCAALYWARFITPGTEHEILKWMQYAAKFADQAVGDDKVNANDLRHAAGLCHSLGIRRDHVSNLSNAEQYLQTLIDFFENDVHIGDLASAANTQICLAQFKPEQAKHCYTKALNFINAAIHMVGRMPLNLLKMHLPFVQDLQLATHELATQNKYAKPLATKFDAYAASIAWKIAELERLLVTPSPSPLPSPSPTSMLGFHSTLSSPSPTASTEGPTPDPDGIDEIDAQRFKKLRIEDIDGKE